MDRQTQTIYSEVLRIHVLLLTLCACVSVCVRARARARACVNVRVFILQVDGVVPVKPSLLRRFLDEVIHYYHGFRLLALDTRVAFRLLRKTMRGTSLTRRELKQVV